LITAGTTLTAKDLADKQRELGLLLLLLLDVVVVTLMTEDADDTFNVTLSTDTSSHRAKG
jgi:hypothetical protein